MNNLNLRNSFMVCFALMTLGCGELVTVDRPKTEITNAMVFSSDATALSAIRGIYSEMAADAHFTNTGISVVSGLASDEFYALDNAYWSLATNSIRSDSPEILHEIYQPAYRFIYLANSILEGVKTSPELTEGVRAQIEGEALFLRALCYFYLTNLFGPVPLALTTDIKGNSSLQRSRSDAVYELIQGDLLRSKALLTKEFSFTASGERIRATYWAACALLARVYLYEEKWSLAAEECSELIDRTDLFELAKIDRAFNWDSKEAIWQLYPVIPNSGSMDAAVFLPQGDLPRFMFTESQMAVFAAGDLRRRYWTDSVDVESTSVFYPNKYHDAFGKSEFHTELRLAEILLIRAECWIRMDDLNAASADLNQVRSRAGLKPFHVEALGSQEDAVDVILHERRCELFSEGGHRWLDLKRTGRINLIMAALNYKDWQSTDALFPIPFVEIANNKRLEPQNEGY